jgi:type I restriction enzyme S subunit
MSESWPLRRIDEVATIFDGPHATPKKTASGPWFLSISSLVNGRLELSGSAHLNQADFSRWTRRVEPRPGDVLISYETRLGEAALMPVGVRGCLGRRMALLRPLDGIDPRFLLYAYLGADFQEEIDRRTVHGATVDRIPLNELGEWPIRIPLDRHAQESIAEVLGSIDDAIQVNRHTEELCWRYAEVAFEKEAAKAEVRVTLGSVLDLAYGKALPARSRRVGPVPVFGSGGIVGWHDRPLVAGPGVVVGRKGTVGSVHC